MQGDEVMDEHGHKKTQTAENEDEMSFPTGNHDDDEEEEDDNAPMPFGDDDDEASNKQQDVSGLNESKDSATGMQIGGLDDDDEQDAAGTKEDASTTTQDAEQEAKKKKRKQQQVGPKRRRTRRKVVIDNDATELDGEHMKNMIQDTSDITLAHIPHPADWAGEDEDEDTQSLGALTLSQVSLKRSAPKAQSIGQEDNLILKCLTFEELLARPNIGDDGQLAPRLLRLWKKNLSRVQGKPWPYPKRAKTTDGEEDSVEVARKATEEQESEDEEGSMVSAGAGKKQGMEQEEDEGMPMPQDDDSEQGPMAMQQDDEDGNAFPMGDDDEEEEDDNAAPIPFDDDDEDASAATSENKYGLDNWEMVNAAFAKEGGQDDEEEDEDDPRQEAGTELASSNTKWHKHTVRVLQLFQRSMGNKGGDTDVHGNPKADHLSFDELSKSCSRRTASGVFFELLQLKTWDFIEVDQGESYGDITVCTTFDVHCVIGFDHLLSACI